MFAAQIHRKLTRPEEEMEDLLTSNVFGIWNYIRPGLGLLQFLRTAQRLDGTPLAGLDEVETAPLTFWPWIQEPHAKGAEPDVLIEMALPGERKFLILVEAKYHSEKSSFADASPEPNDQLAREMDNLRRMAKRQGIRDYALVYVTAHTLMPKPDIEEAISELAEKTGDGAADRFYWTSWRRLRAVLAEACTLCEGFEAAMLADLHTIICQLGLSFFDGITCSGWALGRTLWKFKTPQVAFEWKPITALDYISKEEPIKFSWGSAPRPDRIAWRWLPWQEKTDNKF